MHDLDVVTDEFVTGYAGDVASLDEILTETEDTLSSTIRRRNFWRMLDKRIMDPALKVDSSFVLNKYDELMDAIKRFNITVLEKI